jgi:hypothetical protein
MFIFHLQVMMHTGEISLPPYLSASQLFPLEQLLTLHFALSSVSDTFPHQRLWHHFVLHS